MKHLIKSLMPPRVYCGADAPQEVTANYEEFTCEECKKKLYQYWASFPEDAQAKLRKRYNLRPIVHHGIPTFEVEEIPPKHEYQEKLYPWFRGPIGPEFKTIRQSSMTLKEESGIVARNMSRHGNSFYRPLAEAIMNGGPDDVKRVKAAFSEAWARYLNMFPETSPETDATQEV